MSIAALYPRYDHPAIEESYASWQTQMLLRRGTELSPLLFYAPEERAADAAAEIGSAFVLVVTDPLLLASLHAGVRLRDVLISTGADAAVPVANAAAHPKQFQPPPVPYLTLREMQDAAESHARAAHVVERVTWDDSDPSLYLCRTELLHNLAVPLRSALNGRDVAIANGEYIHRWSSLRGQIREDLLDRVGTDAKNVLEFGCGEAPLGEALKKRQRCRVVGIELDPAAAAIAKKRIDEVFLGDAREIVALLHEQFDWIIGGDIVEHLDEPWSFLADLRRLSKPGGRLLLSLPNLANASIVADLLQGRFDYAYMGLTCVGHLRFFTRQSIDDMLTIAGWTVEHIEPQLLATTPAQDALLDALDRAGFAHSKEDVRPTGYYVTARNG